MVLMIYVMPSWPNVAMHEGWPVPVHQLGERMTGRVIVHPMPGHQRRRRVEKFRRLSIVHTLSASDGSWKQFGTRQILLPEGEHIFKEKMEFEYDLAPSFESLPSYHVPCARF